MGDQQPKKTGGGAPEAKGQGGAADEQWLQRLIATGLKIGISKRELMEDYYPDELSLIFEAYVDTLTPLLDGLAEFVEQNPELAAGIVAATTAVVGIVAAFGAWQAATKLLGDGLTSLGGKLGIISAVAGLVAGLIAAFAAAEKSVEDLVEASKELNSELSSLSRNAASARQAFEVLGDATASTEDLIEAKNSLAEIFPELVLGYDAEGNAILASNERIRERIALLEEERRLSAQAAQEAAAQAATAAAEEQARLERQKEMLELWCRGYYVDTAGKNDKKIAEYIRRQLEEDRAGEQMTMGNF